MDETYGAHTLILGNVVPNKKIELDISSESTL